MITQNHKQATMITIPLRGWLELGNLLRVAISAVSLLFVLNPCGGSCQEAELVVQHGQREHDSYSSLVISPDGKFFVTGGAKLSVDLTLWEVATGREIRKFRAINATRSFAISPDGKYLVSAGLGPEARLWDMITGKELRRYGANGLVGISPDGKRVVLCWITGTRVFDLMSGEELQRIDSLKVPESTASYALSPDGTMLAFGGNAGDPMVRVWSLTTGQELAKLAGHKGNIRGITFSEDSRLVFSGSDDGTARVWNIKTGLETLRLEKEGEWLASVAISPDGRLLFTGGGDSPGRIWDATTGSLMRTFNTQVRGARFLPDGQAVIAETTRGATAMISVLNGTVLARFSGKSAKLNAAVFSKDGEQLILGGDPAFVSLWNLRLGKQVRRLNGHEGWVLSVAVSDDGSRVVACGGGGAKEALLWDATTGMELARFGNSRFGPSKVVLSGDGERLITSSSSSGLCLWEVGSGRKLSEYEGAGGPRARYFGFDPDGKAQFALDDRGEALDVLDLLTLQKKGRITGPVGFAWEVEISSDGKWLLTGRDDALVRLWDLRTKTVKQEIKLAFDKEFPLKRILAPGEQMTPEARELSFSANGRKFITTHFGSTAASVWDVATGRKVVDLTGHLHTPLVAQLSPDGKLALTSSDDQTVRLWNAETGKELCQLVNFIDGTWAVVDSEGRFDASNGGDVEGMHWVVGNETITLNQLKERYYEPGLLAKLTGYNKEPLRSVAAFKDVTLFPDVAYDALAPGRTSIDINLADRGGGIGRVQVLVNGKEVVADARPPGFDATTKQATLTVELSGAPFVSGTNNQVRVVAWNAEGYLSSRGVALPMAAPSSAESAPPELYAIVGGVSSYSSPALQLRFAAKDAEDIAKALAIGARRLFGTEKVHLTLLNGLDSTGGLPPTKANFRKAFEQARKAKSTDIFVVYLAGHGISLQRGSDLYCFLTQEARTTDAAVLSDPGILAQTTITSDELVDWIKQVPALKQVMILDTCAAGAAALKLTEKRDVSGDAIRAIDRLKDRTGFHVLMGCASDSVSYEASQYGQGLLTYALLQGMRGAALREDAFVDVSKLFQHAADEVPRLAQNIGGIQRPQIAAPRGASFDVGELRAADKAVIPLASVRPQLLRPLLINADEASDTLNLTAALGRRLRDDGYAIVRGREGRAAVHYVDADEMPGGIRPSGTYTVEGKRIKVKLVLRRDGQNLATRQVEGAVNDTVGLVARMAEAIAEATTKP